MSRVSAVGLAAAFWALAAASSAWAQSGTKGGAFVKRNPIPGVDSANREIPGERPLLALGGVDAVALKAGQPTPGKPDAVSFFDSQLYRFASAEAKAKFDADPKAFAPALAGWSVVSWVDSSILRAGDPKTAAVHQERTYVFADAAERAKFLATPDKYTAGDLLLGGVSPVALVDEQKPVAGAAEHETIFEGWRVRFASAAEKTKFLADVGKYYPTFAGADPIALADNQVRMGDPALAFHYKNRLYLFATQENADKFRVEYKKYSDLDVAEGGVCLVTKLDAGRNQLGKYGITTVHLGRRLLFASEDARKKFAADPLKYLDAKRKAAAGVR